LALSAPLFRLRFTTARQARFTQRVSGGSALDVGRRHTWTDIQKPHGWCLFSVMKRITTVVIGCVLLTAGIILVIHHRKEPFASSNSSGASNQFLPRESWTFVGYATPEAALQSGYWAEHKGDFQALLNSTTPEYRSRIEKHGQTQTESQRAANMQKEAAQVAAYQIVSNEIVSADECILHIRSSWLGKGKVTLKKIANEWKWDSDIKADK